MDALSTLSQSTPEFVTMLESELAKVSKHYAQLVSQLESRANAILTQSTGMNGDYNELCGLLKDIAQTEAYVFLNFTGMTKILKKHDKHSALDIREMFVRETSFLNPDIYAKLTSIREKVSKRVRDHYGSNSSIGTSSSITPTASLPYSVKSRRRILVTHQGKHGTDIIGVVLDAAARHHCLLEDFMLSRLNHNVTFGALLHIPTGSLDFFKDLVNGAIKWDGKLVFDVQDINSDSVDGFDYGYKNNIPEKGIRMAYPLQDAPYPDRIKYAATVLNQNGLSTEFLDDWTKLLLKYMISVERMNVLNKNGPHLICIDYILSVPHTLNLDELRSELIRISSMHQSDVAIQLHNVFRRNKRLVVFDMDSTLIQQEVIDEIARENNVMDKVAEITEAAMNGEIDFKESLRRRVSLLKGTPVSVLDKVRDRLVFTEGAHYLCRALKRLGFKLAVISGGFIPLANYVKNELGLDYAFANNLKVSHDGLHLTGETIGPIVDAERKAELLEVIAQAESVNLDQVVAIGDGANDLKMLARAGLGIAFNAKPQVQSKARARINQKSLKYVLQLLGYSEQDATELNDAI
ncbi:phosphoserine phosphatase serb [Ramicandelaber brevisporus]|nr:phosphoserine phosphatase serb [Ramicandelaber brevisporus]